MPANQPRYLSRNEIDDEKWNRCIDFSSNRLIYGYTIYLDHMSDHWDALVVGDYAMVMPLTWRRKYGIKYLYQPALCQQLGIFSAEPVSVETVSIFLQHARTSFRFSEIFLNYQNRFDEAIEYINYCLQLGRPYDQIHKHYKSSLQQDIRKAERLQLRYEQGNNIEKVVTEYHRYRKQKESEMAWSDCNRFIRLCHELKKRNALVLRNVLDGAGEILSMLLMLDDKNRLYNLMTVTNSKGRSLRANHFLLDNVVKEFASTKQILDFEGSSIPGVEYFYKSFGAVNQPCYFFKHNDLPFPYTLFKK